MTKNNNEDVKQDVYFKKCLYKTAQILQKCLKHALKFFKFKIFGNLKKKIIIVFQFNIKE